ncbi:hypothetical protein [Methylorubrum populi]|uniref:hypothetical protein n=1 Tax=Methylorubrum populi TaxID=223967 RepID=UPI0023542666|nr:hypothetical protein [Methylorubrum populi]
MLGFTLQNIYFVEKYSLQGLKYDSKTWADWQHQEQFRLPIASSVAVCCDNDTRMAALRDWMLSQGNAASSRA